MFYDQLKLSSSQEKLIFSFHFFLPEDIWEVPEFRQLPQSTELPEEVSAVTAWRLPGV